MWAAQQRNATASALAIFDAPLHIPVAREILGGGKADLLGRLPVVTAAKIGRALPVAAVLTPIDVQRPLHQQMTFCRHCENSKLCKQCVSLFGDIGSASCEERVCQSGLISV